MGRKHRKRLNQPPKGTDPVIGWGHYTYESEKFERYYQQQGIVPEGEWDSFISCLRTSLPLSFRIAATSKFASSTRDLMRNDWCPFITSLELNGTPLPSPESLPWYPNQLGWQLSLSRNDLRKIPMLKAFHLWLMHETEIGTITRQETVSMLPPMFLDVQPHHSVLDMCASPGSKTSQIIEMLHRDSPEPSGIVIANDADETRCYMLAHQLKRLRSANVAVTNHDAQNFPTFYQTSGTNGGEGERMYFDRVLCDVPCSGDGTLRKSPDLWKRWDPQMGKSLHRLQLKIAMRGIRVLAINGRMVYSTCSLNPMEDEAVVAEILRQANGSVELVDVSKDLPELKRMPGLSTWKVFDRNPDQTEYRRWEDVPDWIKQKRGRLQPSFFPPTPEKALEYHLERCMRILPHHQNTGGFFIAVFQKTRWSDFVIAHPLAAPSDANIPENDETDEILEAEKVVVIEPELNESPELLEVIRHRIEVRKAGDFSESDRLRDQLRRLGVVVEDTTVGTRYAKKPTKSSSELAGNDDEKQSSVAAVGSGDKEKKRTGGKQERAEQFILLESNDAVVNQLKSVFEWSAGFKTDQLFKGSDAYSNISFLSTGLTKLVKHNEMSRLRLCNAGLKIFKQYSKNQNDVRHQFRVCQEGTELLLSYLPLSKQLLLPRHLFIELLGTDDHVLTTPTDVTTSAKESLRQQLVSFQRGGYFLAVLEDSSAQLQGGLPVCVVCRGGKGFVNVMVNRKERECLAGKFQTLLRGIECYKDEVLKTAVETAENVKSDDHSGESDAEAVGSAERETD